MFGIGNKQVGDNCYPKLYSDSIFGVSPKLFDSKVLFDPLEEHFHLPPVFIQISDFESGYLKVIRQKDKQFVIFAIMELNQTQFFRI